MSLQLNSAQAKLLSKSANLENFRKRAKSILKKHKSGNPEVCSILRLLNRFADSADSEILDFNLKLSECQFALALEYGCKNWTDLKKKIETGNIEPVKKEIREFIIERINVNGPYWPLVLEHFSRQVKWLDDPEDEGEYEFFIALDKDEHYLGGGVIDVSDMHFGPLSEMMVGFLEAVEVLPEFRRQGIGARLVKSILEFAWEKGAQNVRSTVDYEETEALEFYRSIGFALIPNEDPSLDEPDRTYTIVASNPNPKKAEPDPEKEKVSGKKVKTTFNVEKKVQSPAKNTRIMYVELKTHSNGYDDKGPAWIGRVKFSKSGRTIYYRGKKLQRTKGEQGIGNFVDLETGEGYWISGPKKNGKDRHWGLGCPVNIDDDVREEYWTEIRKQPENVNKKST